MPRLAICLLGSVVSVAAQQAAPRKLDSALRQPVSVSSSLASNSGWPSPYPGRGAPQLQIAPPASCSLRNGSGINTTGFACATLPVLGSTWTTVVATTPNTTKTFLGIASRPGLRWTPVGELLIPWSAEIVLPGLGSHSVPIPNDPLLLGTALYTQGFRIDRVGDVPTAVMLNAQDAVVGLPPPGSPSGAYVPGWAWVAPKQVLSFDHDPRLSKAANGDALRRAIQALTPGQRLEIGAGTYSVDQRFDISLEGRATAPIWIMAKPGATPVITRSDAAQNAINIGSNGRARYLAVLGLEVTGGDTGIKIYDAIDLWVAGCHIHHVGGAGIAANSTDTQRLNLTRNLIHDTAGTAEGMYLGANYSQAVMKDSVIAQNHIYDCRGTQGDGIEVKQGSYNNLIAENLVHDCQYPCILVYGTDGNARNIVERNVCYTSGDNVMQVQGEAIVRNNLMMSGGGTGFHSHDHQGQTRDLTVVHNTIINSGRASDLSSWNNRASMVFANNVVYSQNGESIRFPNGSAGVTVTGNVVLGPVVGAGSGWVRGRDLSDFTDVTWNGTRRNATPRPGGAIIAAGNAGWAEPVDVTGAARITPLESGCFDGQ